MDFMVIDSMGQHIRQAKKKDLEVRSKLSFKRQVGVWKNERGPWVDGPIIILNLEIT